MSKEDLLTFEGLIEEVLPDGRFRVLLDNNHKDGSIRPICLRDTASSVQLDSRMLSVEA